MRKILQKFLAGTLMTAMLASGTACAKSGTADTTAPNRTDALSYKATLAKQEISAFPDAFVSGINQYGWTAAAKLYSGKNLALSPASLELALLMARAGAINGTADEMKSALFMTGLSDDEILKASKQLMWRANTNGMEAANSVWMQKDYGFSEDYIRALNDSFMSDAFAVDFMNDAKKATDGINSWASDKTHGKIPEMNPEPLPSDTKMVLVNALYFLGQWQSPFAAADSYKQNFITADGTVETMFMHMSEANMLYSETAGYQMISMPFKGAEGDADSPYSMAFILPAEGSDINELMNTIAKDGFSPAVKGMTNETVNLALPKFEFTFDTSMVKTMQDLGMITAFTDAAEFDKMTGAPNSLAVSDILHKCYIRVDEEGAEAAAVTEVIMKETAMAPQDNVKNFTADRPFLFAIYDETDNTVLFLGAVANPAENAG
jgi:serine protease inhibitor